MWSVRSVYAAVVSSDVPRLFQNSSARYLKKPCDRTGMSRQWINIDQLECLLFASFFNTTILEHDWLNAILRVRGMQDDGIELQCTTPNSHQKPPWRECRTVRYLGVMCTLHPDVHQERFGLIHNDVPSCPSGVATLPMAMTLSLTLISWCVALASCTPMMCQSFCTHCA